MSRVGQVTLRERENSLSLEVCKQRLGGHKEAVEILSQEEGEQEKPTLGPDKPALLLTVTSQASVSLSRKQGEK